LTDQAGNFYAMAADAAFGCMEFDKAEQWYAKAVSLNARLDREAVGRQRSIPELKRLWAEELTLREKEAQADNLPRIEIRTNKGTITLELFEDRAPNTVANFISLVKRGFYKDVPFHRVLEGFMAQGGDPTGTGSGGPGYAIDCECYAKAEQPVPRKHFRGSISMANAGPNTNGSQFFLMFQPVTHLNGRHTVFGRVIDGIEVLADLQRIDPSDEVITVEPDRIIEAKVLRDRGHVYEPVKHRMRR
jgi:cyclophilin family peptidyl-prolyl cis-trans isomerase